MPTKIYVNLPPKYLASSTEPFFRSFTTKELADASKTVFTRIRSQCPPDKPRLAGSGNEERSVER